MTNTTPTPAKTVTFNPLADMVEIAKDVAKNEGKTIQAACVIAEQMRSNLTNVFNPDLIRIYAKGEADRGWLKSFCEEHITSVKKGESFRDLLAIASDKDKSKEVRTDATRMINNIYVNAKNILTIAAWLYTIKPAQAGQPSEETYRFFDKKNVLQYTNADGETLVFSAKKAINTARKALGVVSKTVTPTHDKGTSPDLNKAPVAQVMDKLSTELAKAENINAFDIDQRDQINMLLIQCAELIGYDTAIEILQSERKAMQEQAA